MTEKELEEFKMVLLQQQQDLSHRKDSAEEATKAVTLDQSSVGRLSRMDAMQSQAMALESKRRREIQLIRIEAALERIDNGEFGYCASCDEDINICRLQIEPANPFCVDCAAKL